MRFARWLTAELTYRCPLSCFYCSNPIRMSTKRELTTAEWVSTFRQAREMGCVQLGLTGGEPLLRDDIVPLVREARSMGFYTNLITSAVGLTRKKVESLKEAGLDSVQISFQAEQKDLNDFIGGKRSFEKKVEMMKAVKEADLPLTLNVVIHRLNIDRMAEICEFCDEMDPDHVELASVQYHGWAILNQSQLLPTPLQIEKARNAIQDYQKRGSSQIYYVLPDLIEKQAKRCHQGWGSTYICVNPQGDVTPCLSAHTLPSLKGMIQNVRFASLEEIWEGPVFKKFTGVEWMSEEEARHHWRRKEDAGGCRCQAYCITGDETAMDPVDVTSVHHSAFQEMLEKEFLTPTDLSKLQKRSLR